MNRQHVISTIVATTTFALLILIALWSMNRVAISAPTAGASAKEVPADVDTQAQQLKDLQKQVADLQSRASQTPRIIVAGTATFHLGAVQNNATFARVKLDSGVAARLGADYIVLLTNRFPAGGYPFFDPYWKQANDGFDITLVDATLGPDSTASYESNENKTYLIDWIVVKK